MAAWRLEPDLVASVPKTRCALESRVTRPDREGVNVRRLIRVALIVGAGVLVCLPACDGGGEPAPVPQAPTEPRFEGRTLTQWIDALSEPAERAAALRALQTTHPDDERVAPTVAGCLDDASPSVRELAAKTLATLGEPGIAAAAARLRIGSTAQREAAATALATAGGAGLDDLLDALGSADTVARDAAAAALASTEPGREVLRRATRSGSEERRMAALTALSGREGDAAFVVALGEPALRDAARKALLERGEAARATLERSTSDPSVGPDVRDLLAHLDRARTDAVVARLATHGVAAVDEAVGLGPAAVDALADAIRTGDETTRTQALEVLTRIGLAAEHPLGEMLESPDPALREGAAGALVKIGSASSLGELRAALGSESEATRDLARASLVGLPTHGMEQLIQAVLEGSPTARRTAADTVLSLGDAAIAALVRAAVTVSDDQMDIALEAVGDAGTGALVALLSETEIDARSAATAALERQGARAVPALLDALSHPTYTGREAANTLIRNAGRDGLDALIDAALGDERSRRDAARALLVPLGRDAVRALSDKLTDDDLVVRTRAAESLVPFASSDAEADRVLTELMQDDAAALRMVAVRGVGSLADPSREQRVALAARLRDNDGRVRVAAAVALLAQNPGDKRAQIALDVAWKANEPEVRVAALESAFEASPPAGRPDVVARGLDATQPREVRASAADLLESLPLTVDVIRPVRALARDADAELQTRGKALLAELTKDPWLALDPKPERSARVAAQREQRRNKRTAARLAAIDEALDWLERHQSPGGNWDSDGFAKGACHSPCVGEGEAPWDPALTGMALLCFLGNGHTHATGEYAGVVRRGLEYLIAVQDSEGCVGTRLTSRFQYNHAWAALALVDAYAMTGAEALRGPAERAVGFIEASQNPYLAWRYGVRNGDNDTSVTACMVQVLDAAQHAGFEVNGGVFRGATAWVQKMTESESGRVGYQQRGGGGQRYEGDHGRFPYALCEATTAMGVMIRLYGGELPQSSADLKNGLNLISKQAPVWDVDSGRIDLYYWYWGTLAEFHFGGDEWKAWDDALLDALLPQQLDDDRHWRGSWFAVGAWARGGGCIYATAMCCLMLQTPWRIDRSVR